MSAIPSPSLPSRRTQEERSETTRARLVEATLECLQSEGYARMTVSRIVERAQVSRGTPLHHFPTKAALIEAAADVLIRRIYIQLGHAIHAIGESTNRLEDLVLHAWRSVFGTCEAEILLELMVASRHDADLAALMGRLEAATHQFVQAAAKHYLEPLNGGTDVGQVMTLTKWLLRGMVEGRHLERDPAVFEEHLKLWVHVVGAHMRAKPGINTPPPRPEFWETGLQSDPKTSA